MSILKAAPSRRGMRSGALLLALALLVPASSFLPASASAPAPVFSEDFESGAAGWNATGLWHLNGDRAASGNASFYYGISTAPGTADNTYDTGDTNSGTLTSPAISLSGLDLAMLSFWTYWEGEGCGYEHPIVQISVNGTQGPFKTIHESCSGTGSGLVQVNLTAYVGQVVHVRFLWATLDGVGNGYEGWYVDDVRVTPEATPVSAVPHDLFPGGLLLPSIIVQGDTVFLTTRIYHWGNESISFDAEFFVDNETVASFTGVSVAAYGSVQLGAYWNATKGVHAVGVRVDPLDQIPETDESNNVRTQIVFVHAGVADIAVDIVDVEKVYLQTDNGEIRPNPLQRHVVTVDVCNVGDFAAGYAYVDLYAYGDLLGYDYLGSRYLYGIPAGDCVTETFTWDAVNAVGDVTLRAWGYTHPERETSNNEDTAETFVLVGGTGVGAVVS